MSNLGNKGGGKKYDWDRIHSFICEEGKTMDEACRSFGVCKASILHHAKTEAWVLPGTARKALIKKAKESVASIVAKKAEQIKLHAIKAVEKGMEDFAKAEVPVKTWKDAKTAMEIGVMAAGDQASRPVVNLNFLMPDPLRVARDFDAPIPVEAEVIDDL